MTKKTDKIKEELTKPRRKRSPPIKASDFLSTGSTLLNYACTGMVHGGIPKGKFVFFVGDSQSGKTWLALSLFAEACRNKSFDDYRLIYDDVEGGALMDLERFFGSKMIDRIEPPALDKEGISIYSETIEDFYFNIDDALQGDRPFIWVEDSMDALSSDYEGRKFEEKKTEARGGKKAKGDYGDGKAKMNSSWLRGILAGLRDTGSILIIVNQTRDNVGAGLFEPKKTRSGGHALRFYATLEIWSSVVGQIKKKVKGIDRQIGTYVRVSLKKNRVNGRVDRLAVIPIYHSYGIDDVGSCVDFLIEEGHWGKAESEKDKKRKVKRSKEKKEKKPAGVIDVKEFGVTLKRTQLIKHIEDEGLQFELRDIVSDVWQEIEEACELKRKPRYG
ncbi:hypothetical protein LCGC14_0248580 [marine sediment metagenome]|uniref:RecA family profile 2 domain-containing protein n=1 Tax=marine sediment metagenome TaxID=412755 RepID=A0A0F9WQ51_9ZZZZ